MTVHVQHWPTWVMAAGIAAGMLATAQAARLPQNAQDKLLEAARIDQKLDAQIPLDLKFKDETGREIRLGDYFGKRPVVLVMAYYECPMLCTLVLNDLVRALNVVGLDMASDYDVITVSFDPAETPELAAAKKRNYVKEYIHDGAEAGWHFLTGDADAITQLTDAIGFRYAYDDAQDEFAHGSGIMVVTPEGRMSKYFLGLEYSGRDLRLGLMEAADRRIGSPVDQVLLWCYRYDPHTGRYGLAILSAVRLAAIALVLGGVAWLISALRRERRAARTGAAA